MTFYYQILGSVLFYTALKSACKEYNLVKAIYEYLLDMPWYDSDRFEESLILEMAKKGVIKEGTKKAIKERDDSLYCKFKIVKEHKGYNEVKFSSCKKENRDKFEKLYGEFGWKLIWLN